MRFDEGIFGIYSRMYENRREVWVEVCRQELGAMLEFLAKYV